jgi:hypothetical protein
MSVALYLTRDWHKTSGCVVAGSTLSGNKT